MWPALKKSHGCPFVFVFCVFFAIHMMCLALCKFNGYIQRGYSHWTWRLPGITPTFNDALWYHFWYLATLFWGALKGNHIVPYFAFCLVRTHYSIDISWIIACFIWILTLHFYLFQRRMLWKHRHLFVRMCLYIHLSGAGMYSWSRMMLILLNDALIKRVSCTSSTACDVLRQ